MQLGVDLNVDVAVIGGGIAGVSAAAELSAQRGLRVALLERETLEGTEVGDIVDAAMGRKVGGPRVIVHADGTEEEATTPLLPTEPPL